jgi:hypothetical protein
MYSQGPGPGRVTVGAGFFLLSPGSLKTYFGVHMSHILFPSIASNEVTEMLRSESGPCFPCDLWDHTALCSAAASSLDQIK